MDTHYVVGAILICGLILGMFFQRRGRARLAPLLREATRKYGGSVRLSGLALPQFITTLRGTRLRLTPMTSSLSSSDGGRDITCVDFELRSGGVDELRVQEWVQHRRSAMPWGIGDPGKSFKLDRKDFDTRFHAAAANARQARDILLDGALLKALLALPSGADLQVRKDGRCSISIHGHPRDLSSVECLLGAADGLLAAIEARAAKVPASGAIRASRPV
jgi:hypothetical protein